MNPWEDEEEDEEGPLEWGSTDHTDDILYGLDDSDEDEYLDELEYIRQISEGEPLDGE